MKIGLETMIRAVQPYRKTKSLLQFRRKRCINYSIGCCRAFCFELLCRDEPCELSSRPVNETFARADASFSSGDVLLSINGVDLTQLTYNEAVSVLKAQTAQSQVVLRVIQTISDSSERDMEVGNRDELDNVDDQRDDAHSWTPQWTHWLGLPR